MDVSISFSEKVSGGQRPSQEHLHNYEIVGPFEVAPAVGDVFEFFQGQAAAYRVLSRLFTFVGPTDRLRGGRMHVHIVGQAISDEEFGLIQTGRHVTYSPI